MLVERPLEHCLIWDEGPSHHSDLVERYPLVSTSERICLQIKVNSSSMPAVFEYFDRYFYFLLVRENGIIHRGGQNFFRTAGERIEMSLQKLPSEPIGRLCIEREIDGHREGCTQRFQES